MNRKIPSVVFASVVLVSCQKYESIVQTHQYNDTTYLSVRVPPGIISCSSLLPLSLPDQVPCLLRNVNGSCNVLYLHSGDIALKIPAATSSMLSAQADNGSILHSALVIRDSMRTQNSLTGKLGAGRGNIQLSTGRGNILITGIQ